MKRILRFVIPSSIYEILSYIKQLFFACKDVGLRYGLIVKIGYYYVKIAWDKNNNKSVLENIAEAKKLGYTGGGVMFYEAYFLYALTRTFKPRHVLETGVGPGMSSLFFLKAIQENKIGRLHSIDLPGYDKEYYPKINKHFDVHVPVGYETGWLVDKEYREMWDLRFGDSKTLLPKVLTEFECDFFFHDSLHTEEHMLFEYKSVFDNMNIGGIIASHDVNNYWSDIFINFCKKKYQKYGLFQSIGLTRKNYVR